VRIRPRKRMFVSLLLGLEVLIAGVLVLLWWVPAVGYERLFPGMTLVMGAIFGFVLLTCSLGVVLLVLTVMRGSHMPGAARALGAVLRILLTPITLLGRLVGIPRDDIRRSFVGINNELTRSGAMAVPPERILILMPHCAQNDECGVRITTEVANCRRCGKCDFAALIALADSLGVQIMVATGGSLARRVVVDARPRAIIAVACERDMVAGIIDAWPIPVYGVLLDRPQGPCRNTRVEVEKVRGALALFLPEEKNADGR
jgi:hypothetical protein